MKFKEMDKYEKQARCLEIAFVIVVAFMLFVNLLPLFMGKK